MTDAVFCFGGDAVPAARALAEGAALASAGGARVSIYGAGLAGDAVSVGAWQRVGSALCGGASAVRRTTGGVACRAGDGVVYLALGLADASALMPCPRDRVLNRNVRGLLAGLTALGKKPALYFGRDVVSVEHRPAALVAWDRAADGRVLVEMFVGVSRSFALDAANDGYAPRAEPWFRGKEPVTLAEAWGAAPSAEDVVRGVASRGYAAKFALALRDVPAPSVAPLAEARDDDSDVAALRWSPPVPVAIGFAQAGLARDGVRIADARLAGDFFQDRDAPSKLSARCAGKPATRDVLAAALDATYGASGDAVMEGVRALSELLAAFDAVL